MIISHRKKFIFIHNYKVAGTSIRQTFEPYNDYSFRSTSLITKLNILAGKIPKIFSKDFDGHINAMTLKNIIPPSIFDNYFKFGFVRNPWDWQVSLFQFMLQDKNHHQHKLIKKMKSFEEYLEWRINEDLHLQKDFFYDNNGNKLVNYIGKIETIKKDFNSICEHVDIKNLSLPHLNISKHKKYQEYYNSKTIKMVSEAFNEDIKIFGYSFDS